MSHNLTFLVVFFWSIWWVMIRNIRWRKVFFYRKEFIYLDIFSIYQLIIYNILYPIWEEYRMVGHVAFRVAMSTCINTLLWKHYISTSSFMFGMIFFLKETIDIDVHICAGTHPYECMRIILSLRAPSRDEIGKSQD